MINPKKNMINPPPKKKKEIGGALVFTKFWILEFSKRGRLDR